MKRPPLYAQPYCGQGKATEGQERQRSYFEFARQLTIQVKQFLASHSSVESIIRRLLILPQILKAQGFLLQTGESARPRSTTVAPQTQSAQLSFTPVFLPLQATPLGENANNIRICDFVMQSARAVVTFVSLTAIACSILALSWVGLALLGF